MSPPPELPAAKMGLETHRPGLAWGRVGPSPAQPATSAPHHRDDSECWGAEAFRGRAIQRNSPFQGKERICSSINHLPRPAKWCRASHKPPRSRWNALSFSWPPENDLSRRDNSTSASSHGELVRRGRNGIMADVELLRGAPQQQDKSLAPATAPRTPAIRTGKTDISNCWSFTQNR